jgi:hypothetical protein
VPQKAKETFATLSNYHLRRPLRWRLCKNKLSVNCCGICHFLLS